MKTPTEFMALIDAFAEARFPRALLVTAAWDADTLRRNAVRVAVEKLFNELNLAHMDASIAGTETGAYWRGQDDGCAGTMGRWEESLTGPYPKPGVLGSERMEDLYRQTEQLRARIAELELLRGAA